MDELDVEWRPIEGYEGLYEASSLGQIRRIAPGRRTRPGYILAPGIPKKGYKIVKLYRGTTKEEARSFTVHGLIAAAFLGSRPPGFEVNHIDLNKMNNVASNLEYTTRLDNARHAKVGGRYRSGSRVTGSKLDDDDVRAIRALRTCGWTYDMLGEAFGVSHGTIGPILKRTWWKDVQP